MTHCWNYIQSSFKNQTHPPTHNNNNNSKNNLRTFKECTLSHEIQFPRSIIKPISHSNTNNPLLNKVHPSSVPLVGDGCGPWQLFCLCWLFSSSTAAPPHLWYLPLRFLPLQRDRLKTVPKVYGTSFFCDTFYKGTRQLVMGVLLLARLVLGSTRSNMYLEKVSVFAVPSCRNNIWLNTFSPPVFVAPFLMLLVWAH